ncbi:glycosyltransferase family 2 protein [Pseudomonas gingeri]|uniref:glycosyltransferase family 2 protein n=1 Tax=Pseudomonas gingeri TaxID=117681 RepID=UPI0015A44677|nr:glycosyltransferase family 2 protein [Pseudomonas gingeri]NVZ25736.1 glycosyltransferase family 2 protein [Pseudomonas gingeri]
MIKKKFTFAVLTFNHELYIVEHLESIRFLIESYGDAYDFCLIVADDGSRDQTIALVNRWLSVYGDLFCDVKILGDGTNNGTCFNYTRIWPLVEGELFKITAGDDVYSCVNLFEEASQLSSHDFFSGLPLLLIDSNIIESRSTIFHILATEIIYKGKPFIERLRNIGSINTPNLFCNKKFLLNKELSGFIEGYSVTEDFPMLVKIAGSYSDVDFYQSRKVYVYYRRTSGSTYLVRGSDFDLDKLKVFNYMLSMEKGWLNRFLLRNRIYCYGLDNKALKTILNLNYFAYLLRLLLNVLPVFRSVQAAKLNVEEHQAHFRLISERAKAFLNGRFEV